MPKVVKTQSAWFDIPDDEYGGSVEIVHLKDGEVQAIADNLTELSTRFEDDGVKTVNVRQGGIARVVAAESIKSWKKHYGEDGKLLKCNRSNKMLFLKEDGYLEKIQEFRKTLADDIKEQKEAEEKN